MVDLQDVANVAFVLSVAIGIYLALYGPWAKRREETRLLVAKLASEIESARTAAGRPAMSAYMRLETWEKEGHRLPRKIRREVAPFYNLTESYLDVYILASKIVKLTIYESLARHPAIPRVPKNPALGHDSKSWIVRGYQKSRTSIESLDEALVHVLTEPLLRKESVRWSWLKDREPEFAPQVLETMSEATVNSLLEDIETRVGLEEKIIWRPLGIKAQIRDYRFRHFTRA